MRNGKPNNSIDSGLFHPNLMEKQGGRPGEEKGVFSTDNKGQICMVYVVMEKAWSSVVGQFSAGGFALLQSPASLSLQALFGHVS